MKAKYQTIAEQIRRGIETGTYGEKLPSERKLADAFKTTQTTVRKALDILVADGLVRKHPALGNFIERKVRPKVRISLLENVFALTRQAELPDSFHRKLPHVDIEFVQSIADHTPERDPDLRRSANLAPVAYHDFATPYPVELIQRFDPEQYYAAPFDVHRINGYYYALPLFFSPALLAGDRTLLRSAGLRPDPYAFDLQALLDLARFAARKKMFLWEASAARAVLRALIYSAGDESNRIEHIDIEKLRALLTVFAPLLAPRAVRSDWDPSNPRPILLRFCCRQTMHAFDASNTLVLPMPRELRSKTTVGGEFLLLNSRCECPETALEVAAHFLSPEVQQLFGKHRMGVPVLKSAAIESMDSSDYRDDIFFTEVKHLCANSAVENDFLQRLYSFVNDVIKGDMAYEELMRCIEYEVTMAHKQNEVQRRLASEDVAVGEGNNRRKWR